MPSSLDDLSRILNALDERLRRLESGWGSAGEQQAVTLTPPFTGSVITFVDPIGITHVYGTIVATSTPSFGAPFATLPLEARPATTMRIPIMASDASPGYITIFVGGAMVMVANAITSDTSFSISFPAR
jgi:hypothetical protein